MPLKLIILSATVAIVNANICTKQIDYYTPKDFINKFICENKIYRHIILGKHCPDGDCPPCNHKHVSLRKFHSKLIPVESCLEAKDISRLPVSEVCSNMAAQNAEELISASCPFTFDESNAAIDKALAFECCRNKLRKKQKEIHCLERFSDEPPKKFTFNVIVSRSKRVEVSINLTKKCDMVLL